jgi:hypothetical protein
LETPVAEETSTAVGKAATAETLDIAGSPERTNIGKITPRACPAAAQEAYGAIGDANNSRDTRTWGNIGRRWDINNSRVATAGTAGRLPAEITTKWMG